MHEDHLWWSVAFALEPGDEALGPLPYAGYVNGFRVTQVQWHPLLLGNDPLRFYHNVHSDRGIFPSTTARPNTPRDVRQFLGHWPYMPMVRILYV